MAGLTDGSADYRANGEDNGHLERLESCRPIPSASPVAPLPLSIGVVPGSMIHMTNVQHHKATDMKWPDYLYACVPHTPSPCPPISARDKR